jgi:isocitrate dehydrogenase
MDIKKMRARDLMQKDVKIVDKNTPIKSAGKMMRDFGVSSLIVEPEAEEDAFGIVTRKDIVEAIVTGAFDESTGLVDDVMTHPAITVSEGISIYNCQQLMRMVGVRRLPVMEGNRLVGILSNTDIFEMVV